MVNTFPICFSTRKDFERWQSSYNPQCVSHCRDCIPAYQLRMRKLGRCERPEMMFTIEDDGIVGLA